MEDKTAMSQPEVSSVTDAQSIAGTDNMRVLGELIEAVRQNRNYTLSPEQIEILAGQGLVKQADNGSYVPTDAGHQAYLNNTR